MVDDARACDVSGDEVVCPRCGVRFTCGPTGKCWCRRAPFQLPLPAPADGQECYCPKCLPAFAGEAMEELKLKA